MISVIVPIYNVEKYLSKCIDSIANQSYRDLEIILVDDGSTDSSGAICDEYAKNDNRIVVIHKQNGGLSSARNAGLDVANGEYIGFIDSDDYIHQEMYSKMLKSIKNENADLCICCFEYVYENSEQAKIDVSPFDKASTFSKDEILLKMIGSSSDSVQYITAVNKLYKREIFSELRFEEGRIHEDEFIAHHVYDKCQRVVQIPDKLYYYLQRGGSITNSRYSVKKLDAAYAFYGRYLYFKRNKNKLGKKKSILQAYGVLVNALNRLNYRKNKEYILPIVKKLIFNFDLSWRALRLLLLIIKREVFSRLSCIKFKLKSKKAFKMARKDKKKIAIILATPTHGNLGDQAIVYSEKRFLNSLGFSNRQIIEIQNEYYLAYNDVLLDFVHQDDTIVVDGGGNLGTLWSYEDDKITQILSEYKHNKIIVFPQTMYYDDSEQAKKRIEKNRKVYYECNDLTISFRDAASYEFAKSTFPEINSIFCPDIVMSITDLNYDFERKDVLLCFREDLEKIVTDSSIEKLKKSLKSKGLDFRNTSTLVPGYVSFENREAILNDKWKEFASAKLVITDRLHAMIFSAINSTPCISIDNLSKKVSGSYKWLDGLDYVKCVDSLDDAIVLIDPLCNIKECKYIFNAKNFEDLKKGIVS